MNVKNQKYEKEKDIKYRSYIFAIKTIKFIKKLDRKDLSQEVIMKQLLRAATSIGANIIEAKASSSRKDFTNFYHHALKSSNETRFWLGLLRDSKIVNLDQDISELLSEAIEISNILGKCIISLKKK
jgi:four helix bundle protein